METFAEKYADLKKMVESALITVFPKPQGPEARMIEAAHYSMFAGGKRLRPVMALAAGSMFDVPYAEVLPFGCALEMIHTYSLIHDDLPCMDDDDLRRGQLSCHRQFDEATAVLAGDWLLTAAFEQLFVHCAAVPERTIARIAAATRISRNAGVSGMLGGQAIDIWSENQPLDTALLARMHRLKTGAMFASALLIALDLAFVPQQAAIAIEQYADQIGLLFQIQDDLLDVTASVEQLGKSPGKDARDQKSTYVTRMGLDGARTHLLQTRSAAENALEELTIRGYDTVFFRSLTAYLSERDF